MSTNKAIRDPYAMSWAALKFGLTNPASRYFYGLSFVVFTGLWFAAFRNTEGLALSFMYLAISLLPMACAIYLLMDGIQVYQDHDASGIDMLLSNWVKQGATDEEKAYREHIVSSNSRVAALSIAGIVYSGPYVSGSNSLFTPGDDIFVSGVQMGGSGIIMGGINEESGQYVDTSSAYKNPTLNTNGNIMVGSTDITGHQYGTGPY